MNNLPSLAEIWDALRVAAEADLALAEAIIESAGVIVQNPDLTICYDERGTSSDTNILTTTHISISNKLHICRREV